MILRIVRFLLFAILVMVSAATSRADDLQAWIASRQEVAPISSPPGSSQSRRDCPQRPGLNQLGRYMDSLGVDHGALLIFDRRESAGTLEERSEISEVEHRGRRTQLLRL